MKQRKLDAVASPKNLETAEAIKAVLSSPALLDEKSAEQVRQLIENMLGAPSAATRRNRMLGLLLQMTLARPGVFITQEQYETERQAQIENDWPHATTLASSYGAWIYAVHWAVKYARLGPDARVPSPGVRKTAQGKYAPQEIIDAIFIAQRELAHWPIPKEYQMWVRAKQRSARNAGLPAERLPCLEVISGMYGSYSNALEAAQRFYNCNPVPHLKTAH